MLDGLRRFRKRLKSGRDIGRDALAVVDRWIQKNFESEGTKVGGWQALKKATIKRRRKQTSTILQDTGWLKRSWVYEVGRLEAVLKEGSKKGKKAIGKTIHEAFYGAFHDKGAGALPERRILPHPEEIEKDVKASYEYHLDKEMKKL
jgi:hypothetical protein